MKRRRLDFGDVKAVLTNGTKTPAAHYITRFQDVPKVPEKTWSYIEQKVFHIGVVLELVQFMQVLERFTSFDLAFREKMLIFEAYVKATHPIRMERDFYFEEKMKENEICQYLNQIFQAIRNTGKNQLSTFKCMKYLLHEQYVFYLGV